jgi:hypothetical protein
MAAYRLADERGSGRAAWHLGTCLERVGLLAQAAEAFRRADERGEPQAALELAEAAARCGDPAEDGRWRRRAGDLELSRRLTPEWWMLRPWSDMSDDESARATAAFEERANQLTEQLQESPGRDRLETEVLLAEARYLNGLVRTWSGERDEIDRPPESNAEGGSQGFEICGAPSDSSERELGTSPPASVEAPPPEAEADLPPAGFITVLADAFLVPGDASGYPGKYVVFAEGAASVLCVVPTDRVAHVRREPHSPVLLGDWPATFRGVFDEWQIWYAEDVPWAASCDVVTVGHAARLIEDFTHEMRRAELAGRVHSPSPPHRPPRPPSVPRQDALHSSPLARSAGVSVARRLFLR